MSALTDHVGHRTVLRDERHLRCVDCDRTLVLPTGGASVASTSTSQSPPRLDERCRVHPGGWAAACSGCAADALAADQEQPRDLAPTADVRAGRAAVDEALAAVRAQREQAADA